MSLHASFYLLHHSRSSSLSLSLSVFSLIQLSQRQAHVEFTKVTHSDNYLKSVCVYSLSSMCKLILLPPQSWSFLSVISSHTGVLIWCKTLFFRVVSRFFLWCSWIALSLSSTYPKQYVQRRKHFPPMINNVVEWCSYTTLIVWKQLFFCSFVFVFL